MTSKSFIKYVLSKVSGKDEKEREKGLRVLHLLLNTLSPSQTTFITDIKFIESIIDGMFESLNSLPFPVLDPETHLPMKSTLNMENSSSKELPGYKPIHHYRTIRSNIRRSAMLLFKSFESDLWMIDYSLSYGLLTFLYIYAYSTVSPIKKDPLAQCLNKYNGEYDDEDESFKDLDATPRKQIFKYDRYVLKLLAIVYRRAGPYIEHCILSLNGERKDEIPTPKQETDESIVKHSIRPLRAILPDEFYNKMLTSAFRKTIIDEAEGFLALGKISINRPDLTNLCEKELKKVKNTDKRFSSIYYRFNDIDDKGLDILFDGHIADFTRLNNHNNGDGDDDSDIDEHDFNKEQLIVLERIEDNIASSGIILSRGVNEVGSEDGSVYTINDSEDGDEAYWNDDEASHWIVWNNYYEDEYDDEDEDDDEERGTEGLEIFLNELQHAFEIMNNVRFGTTDGAAESEHFDFRIPLESFSLSEEQAPPTERPVFNGFPITTSQNIEETAQENGIDDSSPPTSTTSSIYNCSGVNINVTQDKSKDIKSTQKFDDSTKKANNEISDPSRSATSMAIDHSLKVNGASCSLASSNPTSVDSIKYKSNPASKSEEPVTKGKGKLRDTEDFPSDETTTNTKAQLEEKVITPTDLMNTHKFTSEKAAQYNAEENIDITKLESEMKGDSSKSEIKNIVNKNPCVGVPAQSRSSASNLPVTTSDSSYTMGNNVRNSSSENLKQQNVNKGSKNMVEQQNKASTRKLAIARN